MNEGRQDVTSPPFTLPRPQPSISIRPVRAFPVSKDIATGGGLSKFVRSTVNMLNPYDWRRVIQQWRQNLLKKVTQLSDDEILRAVLARESYQPPEQRKTKIKNYEYVPEFSNQDTALYRDPKNKHALVVYKGTNQIKDLLPDVAIATGVQGKYLPNSSFRDAAQQFEQIKNMYPGTYETIGHSLGGTKALWVGQQYQVPTHAFNPGYVSYTDDRIDVNNPLANVYTVQGDPISNSILGTNLPNIKVLHPASYYNPLKNHTINAFIPTKENSNGKDVEILEQWMEQSPEEKEWAKHFKENLNEPLDWVKEKEWQDHFRNHLNEPLDWVKKAEQEKESDWSKHFKENLSTKI